MTSPEALAPTPGRARPRGALRARRRAVRGPGSALAFAVRLCLAIGATVALLGVAGYLMIGDQLDRRLLHAYAAEHRADARALADAQRRLGPRAAHREVAQLLSAIARRPGVIEARLVGPGHVVEQAGDALAVGRADRDPGIDAALRRGRSYAGRRAGAHAGNFDFVVPVRVGGGHHAFAVTRDHALLDTQLRDVRRTEMLLGVVGLIGAVLVFYLAGGRSLVRSHRIALRRASRDGLTDLPNERAFHEDLAREVESAAREGVPLGVAVIDVDDFRFLNDRHGRPHGDRLLRRAAAVLHGVRAGERAYRIGGDEFAVLLPRTDAPRARAAGERLATAFAHAGIPASAGLACLGSGHEPDTLLAEAHAALAEARRHGGGGVVHFDAIRDRVAVTRPHEVRALHRLLADGDVSTAFQPIWNLEGGSLLGVEALTRPGPESGLDSPTHAFDVAEQIGRVRDLDALCVRSALRSAPDLPPGALLFLNIAPQTLDADVDEDWLLDAVLAAGLEPTRVVIEVTERSGARAAAVVRSVRRLREQGFQLAIDDVGTGNSGLEMLREVGAEFVKLDRSIVAESPESTNARAVLVAMAAFARQTGAYVIAEGIEDDDVLDYVRTIDEILPREAAAMIQGGQGYGLGRPASALPHADANLDDVALAA